MGNEKMFKPDASRIQSSQVMSSYYGKRLSSILTQK